MTTSSFNFQLSGYRIIEELHRDAKTIVYRAERTDSQLGEKSRSVTLKMLSSMYPSDRDLLEFRHQYTISKNLDLPGVIRHHSLEEHERGYALVLEDFGGISLTGNRISLSVVDVLAIGIQLADTLHALGQQRIIHKDIKPANILIHPVTKQVKLIDLSIASLLPRETQEIVDPNCIDGTLAYLSPEQTGRMNRGIDYRTDFYALGVTLYELLTRKLPFVTEDPIALIHCHLAQVAIPIHLVNSDIPLLVSQLVAKLMAKNVEDRYQTALGIKYDLEQCLRQYQGTDLATEFDLAQRDISNKFLIPEQLYGREPEVQILLDAFDRVSAGSSELLLVAGSSGIGKTAVINEIHKPIVRQRSYFIKGKFDQFNRNIPFSAFIQAFRDLIGQLLSETDMQLASWHRQILAAVGENGQVLIETIPELARIIGAQPPVAELSGTAAQNRFNYLFQRVIEVFTTAEHPLVLFLDDLQWADSASLQSIELLMQSNGYLLLLGAYRDNEVSLNHPLILMLEKLRQSKSVINKITLAPLTFADTNQLVADTLRCDTDSAKLLTESIDLKTHGNPLFITQFLKVLHADGDIRFNPDGYWECDILKIQSLAITDDVVEFIAIQIQKLPIATQGVLKLAACIGARFDLEVLSIVSEQSQLVTTAVWNGLQAGLILPTSQIYKFNQDFEDLRDFQDGVVGMDRVFELPMANSTYRFLHDRVQQAAYSLIPADERQQTHLEIGRLLLANTPPEQQSDRLFEMVNHFNTGAALIQQPEERAMVATLNLLAAQKVRAATAYTAAVSYARMGTQLLGKLAWQRQYQLALELYETLAEATFLKGDFDRVPELVNIVLAHAKTPLDRVKSYETSIQCHVIQKQYQAAISQGLEILQQLGLKLAAKPNKLTLVRALLNTKVELLGKSHQKLVDLPEIIAPEKVAPLRILNQLLMPAFLCSQDLMVVFITSGLRLTLRHGNTPWAALFYSTYGIVLTSLGDFNQSYQMGKLATVLNDRFDDKSVTSQVNGSVAWFCQLWREPLRNSTPLMAECIKGCLDSGNLTGLGLSYCIDIIIDFSLGISLDKIAAKIVIAETIVSQSPDYSQQLLTIADRSVKNLQYISAQPALLANTSAEEVASIDRLKNNNEASALSTIYAYKTFLAYTFEDIPHALAYADAQLPYEFANSNCYPITTLWMFDALTRLAVYPQSERRVQKQLLDRVKLTQRKLLKCVRLMPANFQHKYDLVEAEKYRVLGEFPVAIELYNRAISGAKAHEFVQEEAVAYECTARFYLQRGQEKIAATYMQSAYYCYLRWGAKAKTTQLEQHYPQLLAPILHAQQTAFNPLDTLARITNTTGKNGLNHQSTTLDLASVIQSAQALSSTIDLEELIQQLSQIILQNSGAEACCLALSDLQNDWQIRWNRIVGKELVTTQVPDHLTNRTEYPASLIAWIKNTQQSIIFNAHQPLEIADLYLLEHQPQSVFCLPIVKQQKVLGVLYLEHRHAPDIFTENSKQVISFLCTQAAIALENANLYQESQQAAENIRLKQRDLETLLHDRQAMEIALRASEQRYHQMVSNVPGTLYQFELKADGNYRLNYVSARFTELFEVEAADVLADISVLLNRIVLADRKSFDRSIKKATKLGKSWDWSGRILTPSGQIKWIRGESMHQQTTDNSMIWDGILIDVTEQKVALRERQQIQQQIQTFIDNSPAAMYLKDLEGRYLLINQTCVDLVGGSAQSILGKTDDALFAPAIAKQIRETDRSIIQTGISTTSEDVVVDLDGRVSTYISNKFVLTDEAGKPYAIGGVSTDTTDLNQAKIALQESDQRYHRLVSNIPAALYQFELATDGTPRLNYVSERFPELFEVSAVAVLADARVLFDLVIPEDRSSFDTTLYHAAATGSAWKWEGRVSTPSGQIKWMQGESRPTTTAAGSIVWDGILLDITDRKQAELALHQSEERYQKLSDNIPGVIYQFRIASDGSINYPYISSGCWDLLQLSPAAVMADSSCLIEMMHPDDLPEFQQAVAKSAQNLTLKLCEARMVLNSGELKWIKSVSRPELQSDGSIVWDGVMLDITDRQQAQHNLNLTNERLELTVTELQQATRLKDEFLATMSHELRTPLNAILGMSEALQEEIFGAINARQLNAISTIEQSGEHLLSLINDILDVSKIAAGKLELNITQVSLPELCKSSLMLVKQQAFDKQIQIDTHLPTDLEPIAIDERRMRQVLINLLNNAVKFTPTGGTVTLAVRIEPIEISAQTVGYAICFAVSDTGIGIASADLTKLFQPFIQIDSSLSRKYEGTGLGLVLVKQIVELHGGDVTIDSEVGRGSCFTAIIPQTHLNLPQPLREYLQLN